MFPKMIFTQVEINIIKLGSLLFYSEVSYE